MQYCGRGVYRPLYFTGEHALRIGGREVATSKQHTIHRNKQTYLHIILPICTTKQLKKRQVYVAKKLKKTLVVIVSLHIIVNIYKVYLYLSKYIFNLHKLEALFYL